MPVICPQYCLGCPAWSAWWGGVPTGNTDSAFFGPECLQLETNSLAPNRCQNPPAAWNARAPDCAIGRVWQNWRQFAPKFLTDSWGLRRVCRYQKMRENPG